jgi:hypothetical protein
MAPDRADAVAGGALGQFFFFFANLMARAASHFDVHQGRRIFGILGSLICCLGLGRQ